MTYYHSILNIGYRMGNLARELEIVIERLNSKSTKSKKIHIELYRVQEALKYVIEELEKMKALQSITSDIQGYFLQLTGINTLEEDEEGNEERKPLLTRIKQGVVDRKYRPNRELQPREIYELDLKLKTWKDKLAGELVRLG